MVDLARGERVEAFALEGSSGCWGAVTAPDGALYIASHPNGHLYRYRPGSGEVENLGVAIAGETYLYHLTVDDRGRIYGGTHPNGKLFRFDPATGEFRDYGPLVEGDGWGRSALFAEGHLYAGTGPSGKLLRLDVETGERSLIHLPHDPPFEQGMVSNLTYADGHLVVRVAPGSGSRLYHLEREEWVGEIPEISGLAPSPADEKGRIYYVHTSRQIRWHDLSSGESGETGARAPFVTLQWDRVELNEPAFPGKTLVTASMRGSFFFFNPKTGKARVTDADVARSPVAIQSLATGPDGRIYIGGYLSPEGMAAFDSREGTFEFISGITQIEGMAPHKGKLFIGTYPNANIQVFDPAAPRRPGKNPRNLFAVGHGQLRTFALTGAGDRVAIGSVPADGIYGGALILYDPASDEHEVFRHVVQDHTVGALTYREGVVLGRHFGQWRKGNRAGRG